MWQNKAWFTALSLWFSLLYHLLDMWQMVSMLFVPLQDPINLNACLTSTSNGDCKYDYRNKKYCQTVYKPFYSFYNYSFAQKLMNGTLLTQDSSVGCEILSSSGEIFRFPCTASMPNLKWALESIYNFIRHAALAQQWCFVAPVLSLLINWHWLYVITPDVRIIYCQRFVAKHQELTADYRAAGVRWT